MDFSLEGHWRGIFSYENTDKSGKGFPNVPFEMELKRKWFGRLSGFITFQYPHGEMSTGTARGKVRGLTLSLAVRNKPFLIIDHEGNVIPVREYILNEFEQDVGYNPPNYRVLWSGECLPEMGKVRGRWESIEGYVSLADFRTRIKFPRSTGQWEIGRKGTADAGEPEN